MKTLELNDGEITLIKEGLYNRQRKLEDYLQVEPTNPVSFARLDLVRSLLEKLE